MKKYILILFLIVSFCKNITAQSFEWAKRAGLYAFDLGYGVGADNAGNVYIAGKYEMKANFGGTTVGCAGNHDIYLAKYSPTGVFQWVRTAGGSIGDYAHALAVDGAGNCYLTGEYETTTYFGSIKLTSRGNNDVFLAKYNTNGSLVWVRNIGGGTNNDRGLGISLSGENVYVTGRFLGKAYFGSSTQISSGGIDIFIAKYTTAGVFQWSRRAGGSGDDEGHAISNDPSGNIYVTGYFNGTASFSGSSVTSKGGTDVFIAKYNPSGTLLWVKKTGGTANDVGNAIKVDKSGRVFVTGGFRYTSYFGSIPLTASGGNSDIFIAYYDANGNAVWAKKAGAGDNDTGRAIAVDSNSNIFITGNCGKKAVFGSQTIYGADVAELYFASYSVSGNFRWVLKAGGVVDASDPDRFIEMGLSICTDPAGNVFASGAYRSASSFGSTTLQPWSTHTEVFLTKIRQGSSMTENGNENINAKISPSGSVSYCSGGSVTLKATEDTAYHYQWNQDGSPIPGATNSSYKAASPGNYSVVIIKGNDSIYSEPTIVAESKSIAATITSSAPVFCKDSNVILMTNTGDGYIYQWKRNGSAIPGATAASYKPELSGEYQVKIIQGSCFDWSPTKKIEILSCGKTDSTSLDVPKMSLEYAEPKEDSLLIKIYPNPNKGVFTLELNMPYAADPIVVELVNALGQIVYSKMVPSNNAYINEHIELESSVPTGIYFLQVTVGKKVEKTRMMLCR